MKLKKNGRFQDAAPGLPLNVGLSGFEQGSQAMPADCQSSGFLQHKDEFPAFFERRKQGIIGLFGKSFEIFYRTLVGRDYFQDLSPFHVSECFFGT
jgi:hypothetical protein